MKMFVILIVAPLLLSACASTPQRSGEGAPDDPTAPEAAIAPLRPTLVANTRTFLPPAEKPAAPMDHSAHGAAAEKSGVGEYVCPMHAAVQSDKPDTCPKCGMKLEKKAAIPKAGQGAPGTHEHHP